VIHGADRLNPRAANSLLKTLEEPPPYARFITLDRIVGSILPTVLSRCVAVACEVPRDVTGFEEWALILAGGAPGRARQLQEFARVYKPIFDFAMRMPERPKADALVAAEEFAALADALQAARDLGARAADAEALQVLATAYGSQRQSTGRGFCNGLSKHTGGSKATRTRDRFSTLFSRGRLAPDVGCGMADGGWRTSRWPLPGRDPSLHTCF